MDGEALTAEPLIQLRDVVKAYKTAGDYFYALRSISLNVYVNEFLGIIGKSGAGKSTLLNIY
jgi:putative ABC transport system ATP-binding protein